VNRPARLPDRVPAVGRSLAAVPAVDVAVPAGRRVLVAVDLWAEQRVLYPDVLGSLRTGGGRSGGIRQRPCVPLTRPGAAPAGCVPAGACSGCPLRRVRGDRVCPRAPIGCPAVVVAGPPRRFGSPDLPVFRIGCRRFFVSGTLAGSPSGNLRSIGRRPAARDIHSPGNHVGLSGGVGACASM